MITVVYTSNYDSRFTIHSIQFTTMASAQITNCIAWSLLWSTTNRRTATWNLFVLYNNETNYYTKLLFISKYFNITRKPAFAHFGEDEKKPFDVIYDLYKMKQFYWLLCVAKNCDWSRKIMPLSNLTWASPLVEWKLTAKAELNCEIYKSWRKCRKN